VRVRIAREQLRETVHRGYRVCGPVLLAWFLVARFVGGENASPCADGWWLCDLAAGVALFLLYPMIVLLPVMLLLGGVVAIALWREWRLTFPCWLFLMFFAVTLMEESIGQHANALAWLLVFAAGLSATRIGYRRAPRSDSI